MSNSSKRSIGSEYIDELDVQSSSKKIKFMTPDVVSAMDRANISSRHATHLFCAFASALGYNLNDISVSHSTIHRHRIEIRKQISDDLKIELRVAQCVVIHWDGKLLPDITGEKKLKGFQSFCQELIPSNC